MASFLSPEAQYVAGVNNRDEVAEANGAVTPTFQQHSVAGRQAGRDPVKPSSFTAIQNQGRRAAVLDVRVDHGQKRRLLSAQLWDDVPSRTGAWVRRVPCA
jgi:hypothetical protein